MSSSGYTVMSFDRLQAAMRGFVEECVVTDVVIFTQLVDASALVRLRERSEGRKPSYTALVLKAIALALREHPAMNRLVLGGHYRHRPVQLHEVHGAVAVERVRGDEDTVYAGLIRDLDAKPVDTVTEELSALSRVDEDGDPRLDLFMRIIRRLPGWLARWILKLPRLGPKLWMKHRGGSFALTTVGKYGVDSVAVKWPWPLTFTFGEVKERAIVVDHRVEARPTLQLSMAWHRQLTNGAPAARFFHDIEQRLARAELGERKVAPLVKAPLVPPRPDADRPTQRAAVG